MMREILFRGKWLDTGEWATGDLLQFQHSTVIHAYVYGLRKAFNVDPDTVCQYTGLKDKNGKKIFEGDAIRFHKFRDEPDWVGVVRYENCHYIAIGRMPLAYEKRIGKEAFYCPFEGAISGISKETIEVIGNIHDNPELMEDEK